MPFHVLGHVEAVQFDAERTGELTRDFGFADAGGTREQITADGLFRLTQARARQFDGARQRDDGVVLTEDHGLEVAFEILQRLLVVAADALGRNAGNLGDDLFHVLHRNHFLALVLGQQHARRADFVDHVDGLIRQFAVVDVLDRQLHRRTDGVGGVANLVVLLVIGLEALQDLDGVLDGRLRHVNLLEAAHQRAVFFKVVAVFLVGGRADALQRAGSQSRLQQVGGIHGAAGGGARADHGVDFVDEQHRALHGFQFGDHRFQTLFKVTAITRTGQQRAHVEREDGGIEEDFRHFLVDDAARETFGDGGLAHAGVTHIERVVLGAAAQNLDRALDFFFAADERVDLALRGLFIQVDAVSGQRLAALLDHFFRLAFLLVGAVHGLALAGGRGRTLGDAVRDVVDGIETRHVLQLQEIDRMAFAFGEQRHQHVGARDFFAARGLHMNGGTLHHTLETGRGLGVVAHGRDQVVEIVVEELADRAAQLLDVDVAGAHHGDGVGVVAQGDQKMFKSRVFVAALGGGGERMMKGLFEVLRQH